jgi:hypothetical protein
MKTRTYFAHRIDMLDAAGQLQEHLAGVEDYILAEAVWREAIARWPGATLMQDDREAMGAKAKSGYSRYGDIHRRHGCACVSGRKRCFCWHGTRLRRRSS